MVISTNLSLIPYPPDNYQLQPLNRQALLPSQEHGQQAINRYDLFRRPYFCKYVVHADRQNSTYDAGRFMEPSKVDQLGSLVDIYV